MFFKQIEGEAAILVGDGVYRQTDLYERNGFLFAKYGAGFIRLAADGSTSKAKMRLEAMSWDGALAQDALGRLCRPETAGAKPLVEDKRQKLLAGQQGAAQ